MPKITFVQPSGSSETFDLEVGDSLMKRALAREVDGILAECGGACACATCQVIVAAEWRSRLDEPLDGEASMLDEEDLAEGRRLSCQIEVTDKLDGLVVHIPASQH